MEFAIGISAAVAVGVFATLIGFDKDRSFYPVVLIVIACLYLLFAAMADSTESLGAEAIPSLLFIAMAGIGFRRSLWIVVAGLALHGIFDFFHHAMITNPGVPAWWPGWCLGYDVVAAAYLAALLVIRRNARDGRGAGSSDRRAQRNSGRLAVCGGGSSQMSGATDGGFDGLIGKQRMFFATCLSALALFPGLGLFYLCLMAVVGPLTIGSFHLDGLRPFGPRSIANLIEIPMIAVIGGICAIILCLFSAARVIQKPAAFATIVAIAYGAAVAFYILMPTLPE